MTPKVSVIVCTYNREKYIATCLEHLYNQSSPKENFEVIIINNNSADSTDSLCKEYISDHNLDNFRYFVELNQGHSYSRNRGIKEATSEIITFIDDDAFVKPDFVDNIIRFFSSHSEILAIGGKINPIFEDSRPDWMSKFLMPLVSALDMGNSIKPFKGQKFPIGANMSFRRKVFEKFGMFNVNLGRRGSELEGGDEKEVFIRIKKGKGKICYVPEVIVDHIIPQKRVEKNYIKGLAIGVGTSERKRLKDKSIKYKLLKIFDELIKIGGTVILSIIYYIKLTPAKANMLIRFRYWILSGYLKG